MDCSGCFCSLASLSCSWLRLATPAKQRTSAAYTPTSVRTPALADFRAPQFPAPSLTQLVSKPECMHACVQRTVSTLTPYGKSCRATHLWRLWVVCRLPPRSILCFPRAILTQKAKATCNSSETSRNSRNKSLPPDLTSQSMPQLSRGRFGSRPVPNSRAGSSSGNGLHRLEVHLVSPVGHGSWMHRVAQNLFWGRTIFRLATNRTC